MTGQDVPFGAVIEAEADTPTVLVSLRGELDIATVPALEAALEAATGRASATNGEGVTLIVDLDAVSFLDASGVRPIAELATLGPTPPTIELRSANQWVARVLSLLDLNHLLG